MHRYPYPVYQYNSVVELFFVQWSVNQLNNILFDVNILVQVHAI